MQPVSEQEKRPGKGRMDPWRQADGWSMTMHSLPARDDAKNFIVFGFKKCYNEKGV